MNDDEFEAMVDRNADDIRRHILRRARLQIVGLVLVLAAAVVVLVLVLGVLVAAIAVVVVGVPSVVYGWWSWRRRMKRGGS